MTTGCEWASIVAAGGCAGLGSECEAEWLLVVAGGSMGFTVRGDGLFLAVRVPILSDVVVRGDWGACCM